ncbi:MAG: hypothetical protein AB7V32_05080, partial [Candidatus Berkiella sp.]
LIDDVEKTQPNNENDSKLAASIAASLKTGNADRIDVTPTTEFKNSSKIFEKADKNPHEEPPTKPKQGTKLGGS